MPNDGGFAEIQLGYSTLGTPFLWGRSVELDWAGRPLLLTVQMGKPRSGEARSHMKGVRSLDVSPVVFLLLAIPQQRGNSRPSTAS